MADRSLSTSELRLLVVVAESGSFTAAAAALGLTQPAVSHAVRGCERKLGAVLFDRGRHGAHPTDAGVRAVGQARHILRLVDTLGPHVRGGSDAPPAGTVRIAAFRSAAAYLLPPALERLAARHPLVTPEVRIVQEIGRGTAGEVVDGRADIGIATVAPTSPVPDGLHAIELFAEPYALARPAGQPNPRGLPLLDWDENCSSYTRRWWAEQDWLPAATLTVQDDSVVLSMVAQGIGIAVMPRLTLAAAPPGVDVVPLEPDPPIRHVGYVTTAALAATPPVRALIRALRDTAPRPAPTQYGR